MQIGYIWIGMMALSLVFSGFSGHASDTAAAFSSGAGQAVKLCFEMGGAICFWSGVMEVMARSGLTEKLSKILFPVLHRLFPKSCEDGECAGALSQNLAANLLGLGNAATPSGLRAVRRMDELGLEREMSRLVVINTASIQLLPTTIAALRTAKGAANGFDILPCVLLASAASVAVGLAVNWLTQR